MSSARPHRLAGQRPDEWSAATAAEFDDTVQTGRSRPLHLPSVIAHHPTYLAAYMRWAKAVALEPILAPRASAILALRSALNSESAFEWGVHVERALVADCLTPDEVTRLGSRSDREWDGHDRVLIAAADDLAAHQSVSDDTWAALSAHHSPGELVEIVVTVGHYTMLAMIANSAGIPCEPWWAPLGEAPAAS